MTVRNLAVIASSGTDLSTAIQLVIKEYKILLMQVVTINCNKGPNMISPDFPEEETETDNEVYYSKLQVYIEEGCHCLDMRAFHCLCCAAHSIQFCALQIINDETDDFIRKAFFRVREVVKVLNTTFSDIFTSRNIAMLRLDCPTRWLTTMDMVGKLVQAKVYFEEENITAIGEGGDKIELNDDFWRFTKVYCDAMEPVKRAIIAFQKPTLTLSQFYEEWWGLKLLLNYEMDEYAKQDDHPYLVIYERITDALGTNELHMFENEALHGCLYLDPRFQVRNWTFSYLVTDISMSQLQETMSNAT
jgi:hypothetical protein